MAILICECSEYLPILKKYAANSQTVVEFGMRTGTSTFAILAAAPKKVISVDIHRYPEIEEVANDS